MNRVEIRPPIIVTGGAGFIGSNFVRFVIRRKKHRVMVVDKLTYAGHRLNLSEVERDSNFEFVLADINDRSKMDELLYTLQPEAVVNFAAETHVDRSIDSPQPFLETNTVGTFHLLEAVRGYLKSQPTEKARRFRYLHVSTDEVYGALGKKGRFNEKSPYRPNSPYAASKAAADHLVRAYHETYQLPVLITNCSNNYGPYQFPEKLIPLALLNAIEGKTIPIYGDGAQVRDWIFVEDHCDGIWRVLKAGKVGETYAIGAKEEHTNLEVVKMMCAALGKIYPVRKNTALVSSGVSRYEDLIQFVPDRPGHDRRYAIDSTKIRRELNWKPAHSFPQAIKKTVAWYVSHRPWCDAVQKGRTNRERLGLPPTEYKENS